MSDTDSAEVALHEYVEVEIKVIGLEDPIRAKALQDTLAKLPGLQSVRLDGCNVFVSYEPVIVVKSDIEEHLRQAGFQIDEIAVASVSPVVDAITPHSEPPS